MSKGGNPKSNNTPTTFNTLQVWRTSQGDYYCTTAHKNDDLKHACTRSQRETLTLGYPEDRVTHLVVWVVTEHPGGLEGSLKDIFRRNHHSPRGVGQGLVKTLSPGTFPWMVSQFQRENFLSQPYCSKANQSKGFSSRGPIYKQVGSKLWSYMGMVQKLPWDEVPHCLRTPFFDQRVLPLLLPQLRGVRAWSHCALRVTRRLATHQSAYVTAAMVG